MKQKILAAVCALALCAALVPAGFAKQAAADTAPVAENLELTTFRGTSIGGTLSANAPDGSPLTFRITTEPIKGTVTLTDSGTFVYTPADGKRGRVAQARGADAQRSVVHMFLTFHCRRSLRARARTGRPRRSRPTICSASRNRRSCAPDRGNTAQTVHGRAAIPW